MAEVFRGAKAFQKLARPLVVICGAGAVGSTPAGALARQGFRRLRVVNRDRVEERDLGTQVYTREDVGALKAEALRHHLYRAAGAEIEAVARAFEPRHLKRGDLVVDGFDNREARLAVPCLHVGFNGAFAEIRWNERYRVPSGGGEDVCDYPLARNLVLLAAAVAAEALVAFVLAGAKQDYSITLGDLKIHREEGSE